MSRRNGIYVFFLLVLAVVVLFFQKPKSCSNESMLSFMNNGSHNELVFPGGRLCVVISDNAETRELGLSGTSYMPDNNGMFFVFNEPGIYGFWMKDMNYPLDIIFIDENYLVQDIYSNLLPSSYPKIFFPTKKIKYTLEINANMSEKLGIIQGQKIIFAK